MMSLARISAAAMAPIVICMSSMALAQDPIGRTPYPAGTEEQLIEGVNHIYDATTGNYWIEAVGNGADGNRTTITTLELIWLPDDGEGLWIPEGLRTVWYTRGSNRRRVPSGPRQFPCATSPRTGYSRQSPS